MIVFGQMSRGREREAPKPITGRYGGDDHPVVLVADGGRLRQPARALLPKTISGVPDQAPDLVAVHIQAEAAVIDDLNEVLSKLRRPQQARVTQIASCGGVGCCG